MWPGPHSDVFRDTVGGTEAVKPDRAQGPWHCKAWKASGDRPRRPRPAPRPRRTGAPEPHTPCSAPGVSQGQGHQFPPATLRWGPHSPANPTAMVPVPKARVCAQRDQDETGWTSATGAGPSGLTHCPTPKPRPGRLTPLPLPVFPGQLPPPLPPATCRAQRRLPEALPRAWSEGGAPGQFGGWGRGCSCRAAPAHRGRWSRPADWEARLQEAVGRRAGERGLSRRGRQEGLREDPAPNRQLAALLGAKGLGLLGSRDSGPCHQAVQVSKRLAHLGARGVGAPQESALEELCVPTAQAPRGILKQHHPGITRPEAKGPSWVTSQVQGPRRRPAYGSCDFGTPGSDRPA